MWERALLSTRWVMADAPNQQGLAAITQGVCWTQKDAQVVPPTVKVGQLGLSTRESLQPSPPSSKPSAHSMATHPVSTDTALAKALHVTKAGDFSHFLSFHNDPPPYRPDGPSTCLPVCL